jgi:DNA ligase-1
MVIIKGFPPLYKRSSSTGKMLVWRIFVTDTIEDGEFAVIATEHGQLDGQMIASTDIVKSGKNIGKANETTAREQATAEAASRWTKKRDKGYYETVDQALVGEGDFSKGADAMLAHTYSEHGSKMTFPCAVQPKLDGIRCLAVLEPDGHVTLWTRNKKQIRSVPHIEDWLWRICGPVDRVTVLDGELYNHKYRDNFEVITSLVRQSEPSDDSREVEYHVYDIIDSSGFDIRLRRMLGFLQGDDRRLIYSSGCPIRVVETVLCPDQDELLDQYAYFRRLGYEGAMARRLDVPYEGGKRSYSLLKLKTFVDDDYKIVDFVEGRGKLAGHVGAFVCKTAEGKMFKAKLEGDQSLLRDCFEHPEIWTGKLLTVRYQNLTTDGIPRFPVGVRFRDEKGD